MKNRYLNYLKLFWQLFKTDCVIFNQFLIGEFINIAIWFSCAVLVTGYIFQLLGMFHGFGAFYALSMIMGEGYWRIWNTSFELIDDLNGAKTMFYQFTLPLHYWMVFLKNIVFFAFKSFVFSMMTIPLCAALLWSQLNFSQLSILKFFFIFVLISFFLGSFYILLSSLAERVNTVRLVGIRVLFPLWMFGSIEFPLRAVFESPDFKSWGYVVLLNPMTYAAEAIHSTVLGEAGFLKFWLCVSVVLILTIGFTVIGTWRFKKRLDLV
ncbi:MAG: hypothetical protein UR26_C0002G0130 [candidate division TM6 bacterium GW2011_GWF2_32_72]|nr:MAG: hypothetical protein UR26_C0002G0130 [candidate division TM6 bacterium GW2011_GWF2_32_72]